MKKTILILVFVLTGLSANVAKAQTVIGTWTSGATTCTLTDDSVFTVSGSGAMADYLMNAGIVTGRPWESNITEIKTAVIGDSVTTIGHANFANCSGLTSVRIGNSVTKINSWAFSQCGRSEFTVTIPESVTTISQGAFYACNGLTSVTIPNSVTTIGNSAFASCRRLTSLTISNSVTIISDAVFNNCIGLTSVTIPNSVTTIGKQAFLNCSGLTSLTIGSSVKTVGDSTFAGCNGLQSITCLATNPHQTLTSMGENVFPDFSYMIPVYIPCGTMLYYQNSYWDWYFNNFIEEFGYTLNVENNDSTMGMTVVTQLPTCSNNRAVIEAMTKQGYRFVKWNDDYTTNPRTIIVTSDTTFTAIFEATNGLEEITSTAINIYPNPAKDNINFSCSEAIKVIEVFNIVGQQVYVAKVNDKFTELNVAGFAKGSYIAKLHTAKGIVEKKFVVE